MRLPLDRPPPLALEIALTLARSSRRGGARRGARRRSSRPSSRRNGGVGDVVARALGFGIDTVTVSGATHMSEPRILSIAGISAKNSLPFFDVAARAGRGSKPIRSSSRRACASSIRIRSSIDIVERTPYARLAEGRRGHADRRRRRARSTRCSDGRYVDLPFVVGEGANARVREFTALLDALAELRPRVEAGVLVGQRRWNLKLKSGIDVKLPEIDPQAAIATLLRLQRQSRILERDVLALDLRAPGRVFVRLSQEAAAAWADAHAPKKGAQP